VASLAVRPAWPLVVLRSQHAAVAAGTGPTTRIRCGCRDHAHGRPCCL